MEEGNNDSEEPKEHESLDLFEKQQRPDLGDPLERFTNFNLAQSTVRIIHNMGFAAANLSAVEVMSRLMERYFEDLCKRVAYSKEQRDLLCLFQFHSKLI